MARKTVRVEIPSGSPDDMITLMDAILAKELAPDSAHELDPAKVSKLSALQSGVKVPHGQAKALDAQAQTLRQQRDTQLGTAAGQSVDTKDTVLYLVTRMRDALLMKYEGNEEALSNWGFNVVVGTAKAPTRKPKTP